MTPRLRMQAITKAFDGIRVLHGASLDVEAGEVMGLVGENGAGKSTLMKIVAGVHTDWDGMIALDGVPRRLGSTREAEAAGIAIIYQELNLVGELSLAENIFLGREPTTPAGFIDYPEMNTRAVEIMAGLGAGMDVTRPVGELRVGRRQLVEIGKALSQQARIVIMDEPSSALSETEIQILFSTVTELRARGVTVIYISHRLGEIFEVCDRVTVMRDGRTVGVHATGEVSRQELIAQMVGRNFEQFFVKAGQPQPETVLEVRDLTRRDPDRPGRRMIDRISFEVRRGEVFGIAGLLGSGRTELLEALFGAAGAETTGQVLLNGRCLDLRTPAEAIAAGFGLLTEDRKDSGLVPDMSVIGNLTLAALADLCRGGFISRVREQELAETYLHDLSITAPDPQLPITSLSGGNQQKVLLARWLATNPAVLLLDEPTRGIDVGAKHELYLHLSRLTRAGMAIVLTSSELPELLSICDRIMVLCEGRPTALFDACEATQETILAAAAPAV